MAVFAGVGCAGRVGRGEVEGESDIEFFALGDGELDEAFELGGAGGVCLIV